jgi:hypothetical protein
MGIRPISSTWRVLGTHRYPDLWDIYLFIYWDMEFALLHSPQWNRTVGIVGDGVMMANTGSHVYLWPEHKRLSMQTGLEVWVVCLQVLGKFSLERVFGSKVYARKPHQDQWYLYLTRPFWIWKKLAFDSTKQRGSSQKRGTQVRYKPAIFGAKPILDPCSAPT